MVFCRFNDIPDIPLGYVFEGQGLKWKIPDGPLSEVVNGKKVLRPQRSIKDSIPAGYKLIRKLLAEKPDLSVVLIVVGPETNIERLLNSEADEYSALTGIDLVKQKVKLFR